MNCLITWDGPCDVHGKWHACRRDEHKGEHACRCGAKSAKFLGPGPKRERPERIYQKAHGTVPRRTRAWQRRDPDYYWPKYLKRKRGLL